MRVRDSSSAFEEGGIIFPNGTFLVMGLIIDEK